MKRVDRLALKTRPDRPFSALVGLAPLSKE